MERIINQTGNGILISFIIPALNKVYLLSIAANRGSCNTKCFKRMRRVLKFTVKDKIEVFQLYLK
jgi:hypothetical protein